MHCALWTGIKYRGAGYIYFMSQCQLREHSYCWTHLAGVVTFVSPVEAVDAPGRLRLLLGRLALVDVQPGGDHVNDKETNQVTEI